MSRRWAAGVLAAVALAGCGGGRAGLTPVEQNQLLGLIAQARSQATAGQPTTALNTLTTLRDRVSTLRREGVLDPQRAARMQSVAAQAQSAVRAQIAAAQPKPKPVPTPVVTPPAAPSNPVQTIIQDAQGLQQRAQHALGKGADKLKQKLDKLRRGLDGGKGG